MDLTPQDDDYTNLCIHLTGPSFNYSKSSLAVDLFSFSQTVIDVQALFDRSFAAISGVQRLTKKDRQEFKLIANKIRPGSLEIEAALSLTPVMIPLITEYVPTTYKVIKTTIEAFELSKKLRELLFRGTPVTPTITNNYNQVGTVNNINAEVVIINNPLENQDIVTDKTTYLAAISSSRAHERLVQHMNRENVDGIRLATPDNDLKMEVSVHDKYLFRPKTRLDDTLQKYQVKIHAIDIETNSGELRIFDNDRLSDPIRFSIIGAQDLYQYTLALNMDVLPVSALPEYKTDLNGQRLSKLHIARIIPTA